MGAHVASGIAGIWSWKKPTPGGTGPSERSNHTATAISDKEILIFGGQICKTTLQLFNDVYILNTGLAAVLHQSHA
jgi:hypothetical protein